MHRVWIFLNLKTTLTIEKEKEIVKVNYLNYEIFINNFIWYAKLKLKKKSNYDLLIDIIIIFKCNLSQTYIYFQFNTVCLRF